MSKENLNPEPKLQLSRLYSLDLIRGIAAFFMVQGHFIYNTMSKDPKLWFTNLFFSLLKILFTLQVGPCFFLLLELA